MTDGPGVVRDDHAFQSVRRGEHLESGILEDGGRHLAVRIRVVDDEKTRARRTATSVE